MSKAIIFLLNKLPVYALKEVIKASFVSLEINNGKITGYKHMKNPHTDR